MNRALIITILLSALFSCTDHRMKGHAHKDDSTDLLGTDKNNNGVRDDLESYLIATFKDKEWNRLLGSALKRHRDNLGFCYKKNISAQEVLNQKEIYRIDACLGRSKRMDQFKLLGAHDAEVVTDDLMYNTQERRSCRDKLKKRYVEKEGRRELIFDEDCTKYKIELGEKK